MKKHLSKLTKKEVAYICSVIPLKMTVEYFRNNPKEFTKIMPGFRAKSLKRKEQVSRILIRGINKPFVSSYIEKNIEIWLCQIQEHINKYLNNGDSREAALIKTLPFCFFVEDIGIYCKLVEDEYSEEYIRLLSESIKTKREYDEKLEQLIKKLEDKESENYMIKTDLNNAEVKLVKCESEINALKSEMIEFNSLKSIVNVKNKEMEDLNNKLLEYEEYVIRLKSELAATTNDKRLLEIKVSGKIERVRTNKFAKENVALTPKCPKDIDEFKDYLGYNLENIGVPTHTEYFHLLKEHLSDILFKGIPIIIDRNASRSLIICVANALIGNSNIATLVYTEEISQDIIEEFLSSEERIVCLDNFIGNFDETILITLCDNHIDKIIFLTTFYDRTLYFVPEEFMKYCNYLNLNRIEALTGYTTLTEDPSIIDEVQMTNIKSITDKRWSSFLFKSMEELGVGKSLSQQRSTLVSSEQKLCCLLAFDILPYCIDVLHISPFNVSEKLLKYAGDSGRCLYKNLFKRWFI